MKNNFIQFINEEARLRGNIGVPEEKLREIQRKAETEKRIRIDDPRQEREVGMNLMSLVRRSNNLVFGSKSREEIKRLVKKLEDLARKVIMSEYEDILQNVDLTIKLVPMGKVIEEIPSTRDLQTKPSERKQKELSKELEKEEEKKKPADKLSSFLDDLLSEKPKPIDWLKTMEYKMGVDVAKLINAIGQGEAKNTKQILHSEIVKSGLKEIFGAQSDEIFRTWDQISKEADKLDWLIPIERKSSVMAENPEGTVGAVEVSWPEAEGEGDDAPSSDDAEDILKKIEKGQDLEDLSDEISELLSNGNPKIMAVGVDFPMLLHETVKGIYQLIGSAWLPSEKDSPKEIKKAEIIKTATSSLEDEAEDFRYGPYLSASLRDFINSCPGADRYPNIREYVWGDMCYMARTEEGKKEFLELFKGILENTTAARTKITKMIDDVISRIREYEISNIGSDDDWEKGLTQPKVQAEEEEENDYSKYTKRELDAALNKALDEGDWDEVKKISAYIKESIKYKLRR